MLQADSVVAIGLQATSHHRCRLKLVVVLQGIMMSGHYCHHRCTTVAVAGCRSVAVAIVILARLHVSSSLRLCGCLRCFFFATLCMTDRVLIQRNAMNFETVWVVYALPRTSSTHVHSSTVTH